MPKHFIFKRFFLVLYSFLYIFNNIHRGYYAFQEAKLVLKHEKLKKTKVRIKTVVKSIHD